MSDRFYSHGKFFDDEQDFLKFVHDWPNLPFDIQDFKKQLDFRIKEAEINMNIRGNTMTNKQAYQILRLSTDWTVDI